MTIIFYAYKMSYILKFAVILYKNNFINLNLSEIIESYIIGNMIFRAHTPLPSHTCLLCYFRKVLKECILIYRQFVIIFLLCAIKRQTRNHFRDKLVERKAKRLPIGRITFIYDMLVGYVQCIIMYIFFINSVSKCAYCAFFWIYKEENSA